MSYIGKKNIKKYNKYEDWVKAVSEDLLKIPKIITEEWLNKQLLNRHNYFRNWGFCFANLKEHKFEDGIRIFDICSVINELSKKKIY